MVVADGKFAFTGTADKDVPVAFSSYYFIDNVVEAYDELVNPKGKVIDRALRGKALHNKLQKIFGE